MARRMRVPCRRGTAALVSALVALLVAAGVGVRGALGPGGSGRSPARASPESRATAPRPAPSGPTTPAAHPTDGSGAGSVAPERSAAGAEPAEPPPTPDADAPGGRTGPHRVLRVVDGDTIDVEGVGRVRLLGVDTPETVHPNRPVERFGREASAFTKRTLGGREVWLEYDQQRKDRYGRALAYVRMGDGDDFNARLVREGYAHAYTRFPFARLERYRTLEREARAAGRGLWAGAGEEGGS